MIDVSTRLAMAELMLSGCATSSDHLHLFPNGVRLEDQLDGGGRVALLHAMRGVMSAGESKGGLPPNGLIESEPTILRDPRRVTEAFHDPSCLSMRRIVVAPCSPFSVSPA